MKKEFDPVIVAQARTLGFSPDEIKAHEIGDVALRGDQPPEYLSQYETVESVIAMGLTHAVLAETAREFRGVQAWHLMRGRLQLAQKYKGMAATVRQVLGSKNYKE